MRKNTLSLILVVLLLISLWIIGSVQLQIIPYCRSPFTSELCQNINTGLLSLSYSYIAALLFYGFTTVLPYWNQRRIFKPVIIQRLNNIQSIMESIISEFAICPDGNTIKCSMEVILMSKNWTNVMDNFHKAYGIPISYVTFVSIHGERICNELAELITIYGKYMDKELISRIEEFRNIDFFRNVTMMSQLKDKDMVDAVFKKILVEGFCHMYDMFQTIRKDSGIDTSKKYVHVQTA